jgi:hypothetical protein
MESEKHFSQRPKEFVPQFKATRSKKGLLPHCASWPIGIREDEQAKTWEIQIARNQGGIRLALRPHEGLGTKTQPAQTEDGTGRREEIGLELLIYKTLNHHPAWSPQVIVVCLLAAFFKLKQPVESPSRISSKNGSPFFCTYRVCESEEFFPKKLSELLITYVFYWKAALTPGNHFRSQEINHRLTGWKGGGLAT